MSGNQRNILKCWEQECIPLISDKILQNLKVSSYNGALVTNSKQFGIISFNGRFQEGMKFICGIL